MQFTGHVQNSPLELPEDAVHVWRASLEQATERVQQLFQILSQEERARAARFRFDRDRRRFIVGRGVLRTILSLYLAQEPEQLEIHYGPYGKPYLAEGAGEAGLKFNLAHSHELAVYAFTIGHEIGIDLEYIHHIPDAGQIAARFFSASENSVLNALPANQKLEAFFHCWTRKEAYIKAVGNGLAQPLDKFDVSLAPGEPARLLNVEGKPGEASCWSLKTLNPAPGYVAALAVRGHDWQLQWGQWPGE